MRQNPGLWVQVGKAFWWYGNRGDRSPVFLEFEGKGDEARSWSPIWAFHCVLGPFVVIRHGEQYFHATDLVNAKRILGSDFEG